MRTHLLLNQSETLIGKGFEIDDDFKGTKGNNKFTGTSGADYFNLIQGGNDTATGGAGNDTFAMGAQLTASDKLDGGADNDTVTLDGDYNLVLDGATLQNIEHISFTAGHDYALTLKDGNVAAGAYIEADAFLNAGDTLVFDAHLETDGHIYGYFGDENDTVTGGAQNDSFSAYGGDDVFKGGGGNDLFAFNGAMALNGNDKVDGGAGTANQVAIGGDYSAGVVFKADTLKNIQDLSLSHGSYKLTMNDGNVAAGATMTIDAYLSDHLIFDGSAEKNGHFNIYASKMGDADLTGCALADLFSFRNDVVSGAHYNTIHGFDFALDRIEFATVTGIDGTVTKAKADMATLDADLTHNLGVGGAHELGAHHAVIFHVASGTLANANFLVVDGDGVAGYSAGHDLVVRIDGSLHNSSISTSDFTS
ncbi:MAG TPA: bluetail domain-containing putative surface protein [Rhizomicrobium sp.]|jgi:hypothetical protein|nr:bluetail domain-containing putative surface protein [Rhizomicrobium sp.]